MPTGLLLLHLSRAVKGKKMLSVAVRLPGHLLLLSLYGANERNLCRGRESLHPSPHPSKQPFPLSVTKRTSPNLLDGLLPDQQGHCMGRPDTHGASLSASCGFLAGLVGDRWLPLFRAGPATLLCVSYMWYRVPLTCGPWTSVSL